MVKRGKMTRKELATELGISLRTLNNWEKEKPKLVKLINLGLNIEEQIKEAERNLKKLKEIEATADNKKFKLK